MTNPYLVVVQTANTVRNLAPTMPIPKQEPTCSKCGLTLAAQMQGVCLESFCPYNLN